MVLPYTLPGSFPAEVQNRLASEGTHIAINQLRSPTNADGTQMEFDIDKEIEDRFVTRELAGNKTTAQKHLIEQLDTFTYLMIAFQFLKYTHSSCLPPSLAHLFVQFLLYAKKFTVTGPDSGRPIFAEHLNSQERHFEAAGLSFDRHRIINFIVAKTRNAILWKTIGCMAYHTILAVSYFQTVANEGRLYLLESGSWYLFSFIGESLPNDYSQDDPWWLRLWKLGLCGLLCTDLVILVLQLILYQSIFLQSTISPKGLRLNERECYILRAQGCGSGADLDTSLVPDIFHVKLYESLGEDPMAELHT